MMKLAIAQMVLGLIISIMGVKVFLTYANARLGKEVSRIKHEATP